MRRASRGTRTIWAPGNPCRFGRSAAGWGDARCMRTTRRRGASFGLGAPCADFSVVLAYWMGPADARLLLDRIRPCRRCRRLPECSARFACWCGPVPPAPLLHEPRLRGCRPPRRSALASRSSSATGSGRLPVHQRGPKRTNGTLLHHYSRGDDVVRLPRALRSASSSRGRISMRTGQTTQLTRERCATGRVESPRFLVHWR